MVKRDTIIDCYNRMLLGEEDTGNKYVPLTFEALLDYLYRKETREEFLNKIGKIPKIGNGEPPNQKGWSPVKDMENIMSMIRSNDIETSDHALKEKYFVNKQLYE